MSTLVRKAAAGTLGLLVAHASLMAGGYVVAVVLARGLGAADYGVYGIIYSVLLGAELIGRLGIPQALSKRIAERTEPDADLEAAGITLTAAIYGPVFLLFFATAPWLAEIFRVEGGTWLFRVAALDIPLYGMYFVFEHVLNGRRRFGAEALGIVLYATARVVGILALLALGLSVAGALVVNALASLAGLIYMAGRVGTHAFRPRLRGVGPVVRLAVPIGLFALGTQLLLSLDLWALNALGRQVSDDVKGLYVAATNLGRLPNVVAFVMSAVLIPSIARALAAGDRDSARAAVRATVRFLAVALLPACAILAVEARGLLSLLFSDAYGDAAPYLAVLAFGHGLSYTVLVTFCSILIAGDGARAAAWLALGLLPFSLVLNGLLVPAHGAVGAAWAAVGANALGALLAAGLAHRQVAPAWQPGVLVRGVVATVAACALAWWIPSRGVLLLAELLGVGLLYVALVFAVRLVTVGEVRGWVGT